MLDRITLFGSRGGRLQPSRNGDGRGAWMAVSPQPIGAVDLSAASQSVRSGGGLLIAGSSAPNAVDIQTHPGGAYHPPQKALLIGDAGPSWVELSGPIHLTPADRLVVPEDRDAQDGVESLRSLLLQLPEDRQGLIWSALSRPDAHYRLSRLEEQVRELKQAPPPAAAPQAAAPEKAKTNWLLVAAAGLLGMVLGLLVGVGAGRLTPRDATAPEKTAKTKPGLAPVVATLPVITFSDLDRLDQAIESSPKKAALVAIIGADTKLSAMNQEAFVAIAKLELHRSAVPDLASMDAAGVVAKLAATDLGPSRPKLLAQVACDLPTMGLELPESFPGCAEAGSVDDVRQAYFNLLDFIAEKPAP